MDKWHNKITEEEKDNIRKEYLSGLTGREIAVKTGRSECSIFKICFGLRTLSESCNLMVSRGRRTLSEEGRMTLSRMGRESCQRTGKFYTKPEREFKTLLNSVGVGVCFPEYVCEIKNVESDLESDYSEIVCFQYPIQRYVVDFADVVKKIVLNVNGDYWHANPLLYKQDSLGKMQAINVRQDKNKRIFLEKHGWKVVDIWESEIYWNKSVVIEKLRSVGIPEARLVYTQEKGVQFSHGSPEDWSGRLNELWGNKSGSSNKDGWKDTESWAERINSKWFSSPRISTKIKSVCECGREFYHIQSHKRHYCSNDCRAKFTTSIRKPAKEILEKEVPVSSWEELGRKYGVSGANVKKWAKGYGIIFSPKRVPRKRAIRL